MAGLRLLTWEKSSTTINYIVNELLKPDVRKVLFDDIVGGGDIELLFKLKTTVIYGIFHRGLPEPVGLVFFTGVWPYRSAVLYSCIFSKENRKKGLINDVVPQIKKDIKERYAIHSVVAHVVGKNDASSHILEKMGFEKVGVKPEFIMSDGKYKSITEYYLILED